jgi:CMP-N-acetylneuraminic acid synthetase
MIEGQRVIALVPARGGSKSIKYKNLQDLGGRSLLAWAVGTAKSVPSIDRVIVSTDDARIAKAARDLESEVYERRPELSGDTALIADVIRDLWAQLKQENESADILVLLECTSPFRSASVVERCIRRLVSERLDSVATFAPASLNPERAWRVENGKPRPFIDGAIPWKPRQQLTPAFELTGAVYVLRPGLLPPDRPSILFGEFGAEIVEDEQSIDIDTEEDLKLANALLNS